MTPSFFEAPFAALPPVCSDRAPDLAVVLGSGWGNALVKDRVLARVPYADIPGFGAATVVGHAGEFLLYERAGRRVAAFCGRRHLYEGVGWETVVLPVELARRLGCARLLLTNAAGGVNPDFTAGTFVRLTDHINTVGDNPLAGPHVPQWGPRFPDLSQVYSPALGAALDTAAAAAGVPLRAGVYAFTRGPVFETPAEIRACARLGADLVGMSTVPEAVFAHACGLETAALSLVANPAAGIAPAPLSHDDVLAATRAATARMAALLDAFVSGL